MITHVITFKIFWCHTTGTHINDIDNPCFNYLSLLPLAENFAHACGQVSGFQVSGQVTWSVTHCVTYLGFLSRVGLLTYIVWHCISPLVTARNHGRALAI